MVIHIFSLKINQFDHDVYVMQIIIQSVKKW